MFGCLRKSGGRNSLGSLNCLNSSLRSAAAGVNAAHVEEIHQRVRCLPRVHTMHSIRAADRVCSRCVQESTTARVRAGNARHRRRDTRSNLTSQGGPLGMRRHSPPAMPEARLPDPARCSRGPAPCCGKAGGERGRERGRAGVSVVPAARARDATLQRAVMRGVDAPRGAHGMPFLHLTKCT